MEEYCVEKGWILLLLIDSRRLGNGRIICRDYEIRRMGRLVPACDLRRSILISGGEFVDLFVSSEHATVHTRVGNLLGEIAYRAA